MGDSRPEGERNFWNGSEAVTASKKSPKDRNLREAQELRGEGGSDVFSSTRHLNVDPSQSSNDYKISFWSQDDSPLIRPVLNRNVYRAPQVLMSPMTAPKLQPDGYGGEGCERVTILNRRSNYTRYFQFAALIVGGLAVFGIINQIKKPKNKT